MSSAQSSAEQGGPPDFRDDGDIRTNWKAVWAMLGLAVLAGAGYFKLQDHDRRLEKIEAKVEMTNEIAIEIRADLRRATR